MSCGVAMFGDQNKTEVYPDRRVFLNPHKSLSPSGVPSGKEERSAMGDYGLTIGPVSNSGGTTKNGASIASKASSVAEDHVVTRAPVMTQ